MKIQYFEDTDTLHIGFRAQEIAATRDLDELALLDIGNDGSICAITLEQASLRTDRRHITMEGLAA